MYIHTYTPTHTYTHTHTHTHTNGPKHSINFHYIKNKTKQEETTVHIRTHTHKDTHTHTNVSVLTCTALLLRSFVLFLIHLRPSLWGRFTGKCQPWYKCTGTDTAWASKFRIHSSIIPHLPPGGQKVLEWVFSWDPSNTFPSELIIQPRPDKMNIRFSLSAAW